MFFEKAIHFILIKGLINKLNMKLDLQSLLGSWPVYSCTHWLRPRNSPPPPHLGSYTSALQYWSAKIDDISLLPPGLITQSVYLKHWFSEQSSPKSSVRFTRVIVGENVKMGREQTCKEGLYSTFSYAGILPVWVPLRGEAGRGQCEEPPQLRGWLQVGVHPVFSFYPEEFLKN